MLHHRRHRRLGLAALGALLVASLAGCRTADGNAFGSPCDSPIAAVYTSYCNPYLEHGGPQG